MTMQEWLWTIFVVWIVLVGTFIIIYFAIADKPVRCYYLDSKDKALAISVDLDNALDQQIIMNGHSVEEVVRIINELNNHLPGGINGK